MKLYDVISDGEGSGLEQRKLYFEGIGAYEGSKFEEAFAWFVLRTYLFRFTDNRYNRYRNVEKNVKDAYHWLAGTYRKGDQVYLFGASRFAASSGRW